jgi:hypothetical protein
MAHELTSRTTGIAQTEAIANIVKTGLQKLYEDVSGNSTATLRFCKVATELLLHDAILETKLLLLRKRDGVITVLAPSSASPVLSRRIRATLQCFGGAKKGDAIAAADFVGRTCVSCHESRK